MNYIIDAYLMFAASAIAGNTFMRSVAGAAFPLFTRQMFAGMGIQWAGTLLGCIALVLSPIPFIFYLYGKKLRAKSKFAPSFPMSKPETEEAGDEVNEDGVEKVFEEADPATMASRPLKEEDLEAGNGSRA